MAMYPSLKRKYEGSNPSGCTMKIFLLRFLLYDYILVLVIHSIGIMAITHNCTS